jgi:hypothetical protein
MFLIDEMMLIVPGVRFKELSWTLLRPIGKYVSRCVVGPWSLDFDPWPSFKLRILDAR